MQAAALISALARSLFAGEPVADQVHARAVRTLGRPWAWLRPLALRYVEVFADRTRPRHRDVVQFLLQDPGFRRARAKHGREISVAQWIAEPSRMQPAPVAESWNLPAIETIGALAEWLGADPDRLEWFSDLRGLNGKIESSRLRHYHYRFLPKRSGGVRLTESPKPDLKQLQRRILSGILDRVPAHAAVHGFVKGRSIVTFAAPHVGKQVLLRLDLENFFPASPAARAQALFRTLGYPESVADRLGGLCTNAVPRGVFLPRPADIDPKEWFETRSLYARPHLPQGAPTSPALANLMAYRLDCRLTGLARTAGAQYTRYADDLAFSGGDDFRRVVERFAAHAAAVALEEGFSVNHRKTRLMRPGVCQHLAGIVVNQKLNLRRRELELLEATLTNCVRLGPETQNYKAIQDFRAHLEGRVGFVEMVNREEGRKLRVLLEGIRWGE